MLISIILYGDARTDDESGGFGGVSSILSAF